MRHTGIRSARIALFCAAISCAAVLLASCGQRTDAPDMDMLTIAGAIGDPDRGAFDATADRYFAWLNADFPAARGLTRDELAALGQHTVAVARDDAAPQGEYSGPLLTDVLELAGAEQAPEIVATALDGYSAAIPMDAAREAGAIVAIVRDGAPLPLGGPGPSVIIFPDAAAADPAWYVWGLVLISVE